MVTKRDNTAVYPGIGNGFGGKVGDEMKKIIKHPVFDVVVTFVIAYILMEKTWILGSLLIILVPEILGIDLVGIMGADLYDTWLVYIEFISIWICGLIVIAAVRSYRPILRAFSGKRKGNNLKTALIGGLSLGFGLNLFVALVAIATGAVKLHYVGMGFGAFVLLLVAVLIQSGAEELVARVFIYQRLRKDFPRWPVVAILGNGVFFMMIHLGNPGMTFLSVATMVAVSVLYSLAVYYFDSIWIPIVAHTTWNFTQSIVLGLPNSGIVFPVSMFKLDAGTSNFAFDPVFGIEGSVLALALTVLACVVLYCLGRKKGARETYLWKE